MSRLRFAALALLFCACATAVSRDERWPQSKDGSVGHHGSFFMVSAAGSPDPNTKSQTQRRSTSRDAAILEARSRLFDYLSRIMINGMSVGERATEDPAWRKRLEAATSGIEVAETKWDEADRAAVILRVEQGAIERALGMNE